MKKAERKQAVYYTLENMDGHIYCGAATKKLAKKVCWEMSYNGVCYKRKCGDSSYKKIEFIW